MDKLTTLSMEEIVDDLIDDHALRFEYQTSDDGDFEDDMFIDIDLLKKAWREVVEDEFDNGDHLIVDIIDEGFETNVLEFLIYNNIDSEPMFRYRVKLL